MLLLTPPDFSVKLVPQLFVTFDTTGFLRNLSSTTICYFDTTGFIDVGDGGAGGAIAPPGKIHQGKTHQNRARSGNDFHTKMTKVSNNDTLQEVFVVQK